MSRLTGWTLVTGGAKRLGRAIVLELARQEHNLLIHYRSSKRQALAAAEECRRLGAQAAVIQGDFGTAAMTQTFVDNVKAQHPDICCLVNNVGSYYIRSALQTPEEEWRLLFETNLHTPFTLIQSFKDSIVKQQGRIINLGVAGLNRFSADTYATAYTIAKQGLLMLTKSLAKELAHEHVTVNMISPGHLENSVDLPQDLTRLPMGRPVPLKEVAQLVKFLFDPENGSITGQNIEVAGGIRL